MSETLSYMQSARTQLNRKRPVRLSITRKSFRSNLGAEFDVGEPGEAAQDHDVAWRRIAGSGEVATETGKFGEVER